MQMDIKVYPDPVLKRQCAAVEDITQQLKDFASDMIETMYEKDGIGLAASQVGEDCRLVTVDVTGPQRREDLLVMVNPEIVSCWGDAESEEGCLSLPEFKGKVRRYEGVKVAWRDLEGNLREREATGLLAACLQHEIDHLQGILLLDRVNRLKRSMYEKKIKKSGFDSQ